MAAYKQCVAIREHAKGKEHFALDELAKMGWKAAEGQPGAMHIRVLTCLSSSFSACTVPSSRHASALSGWART